MGEWTGGLCQVIEFHPDPAAPEIVLHVKRVRDGAEMGVYYNENITMVDSPT